MESIGVQSCCSGFRGKEGLWQQSGVRKFMAEKWRGGVEEEREKKRDA